MNVQAEKSLFILFAGLALAASAELKSLAPCPQNGDPDGWWMKRHADKMNIVTNGGSKVVFIGDSITQYFEGHVQWKKYFASEPCNALNLGFAADRTENVLWRLQNGEIDGYEAKVVVLLIGTNNAGHRPFAEEPPMDTIAGIDAILKEIQIRQPKARIILCSIFPCGYRPDYPVRLRNNVVNRELIKFCDGRKIVWCDVSDRFLAADGTLPRGIMADYLHPTGYGYEIWSAAIIPYIRDALSGSSEHGLPSAPTLPSRVDPEAFADDPYSPSVGCTRWYGIGGIWRDRPTELRRRIVDDDTKEFDAVFVGDSITHRWENPENGRKAYEELVLPNYKVLNLGIGGDSTQHVIWRLENGLLEGYRAKLFMVMIGTNNGQRAPQVADGIGRIVQLIRSKHPESKVLLLPIFPRGARNSNADPRIVAINTIARTFADGRNVLWLDFNNDFLDADGNMLPDVMMPDCLHPIDKGYRIWWNAVLPTFKEIIGK